MNTEKNLYDIQPFAAMRVREPDDEFADLDTLPRGDELTPEQSGEKPDTGAEDAKAVTGQMRDEHGKFVKADEDKGDEDKGDEDKGEDTKADAKGDEDKGDDEDKDDQNFPIRLNKAREQRDNERARADAAEARAAEAEAKLAATMPKPEAKQESPIDKINKELDALYVEVEELRQDGKVADAAKVQRQIDTHNREIARIEAAQVAGAATTAAQINARYDAMLDVIEANIPALDPQHEDYSKAAVKKLDFHVQAYEKMGMRPDEALKEAIGLLHADHAGLFDKSKKAAPAAKEDTKPVEQRKPNAAKAVDTSNRQPPDGAGKGVNKDTTKINPGALSDEEFNALPASKLAEMRGDHRVS
jgi:hypothetical protein